MDDESSEHAATKYGYSADILREVASMRKVSLAPPPITPLRGYSTSRMTEQPLTRELSDAVFNYASGEWKFNEPIWTRRLMRPRSYDDKIFLADAVERLAEAYIGSPKTRFRQASIDLALSARRGDIQTFKRAQVGGEFELLKAESWASWFTEDTLPRFFSGCCFRTNLHGGKDWWIYVEAKGLEFLIKRVSEGEPTGRDAKSTESANADRGDPHLPWRYKPGDKTANWILRPAVREEAEVRRRNRNKTALADAFVEMAAASGVKLKADSVRRAITASGAF